MKNLNSIASERICDLADGRLPDGESMHVLEAVLADPQALQTWHAYHVVGDVLRSPELAPSHDDFAFLDKLEQRLALEPARPQLMEQASPGGSQLAPQIPQIAIVAPAQQVANASVYRWKMLAGLACTAFIGVLGVNLWTQTANNGAQVAARGADATTAPLVVAADSSSGPMIRDPRLDELMAAHRQLGGHSALQVPAGFLRNATFEGSDR